MILNTQADVDAFAVNYPGCQLLNGRLGIGIFNSSSLETDITNLDGLSQLQGFNGDPNDIIIQQSPQLLTIEGLSGFTTVRELRISGSDLLSSFNGLDNISTITGAILFSNLDALTTIAPLSNVQMTGEETSFFPAIYFLLMPQITNFDGVFAPNSTVKGDIRIIYMNGLQSLSGLENINILDGYDIEVYFNDNLQNLNGLENISGEIRSLYIKDNPMLDDISALDGATFFATNPLLTIENNANLSICNIESVCNLLTNNTNATISIENNAAGCETELEVAFACGLDVNLISGNLQFDFNNDGCDVNDYPASSLLVESTDGTNTYSTFSNSDGSYNNYLDIDGTINTSVVAASLPPFFTASPTSAQSTFVGFGNQDVQDFCITATEALDDLKISLVPTTQAVPGFDGDYVIVFENIGSTVLDAVVTLDFNDTRQGFVSASPVPTTINGDLATWNFSNIPPFSSGEIYITLNNFTPPINEIGDRFSNEVLIEYAGDEGDESPVNNKSILHQVFIGSFDPNDKMVAQGDEIPEEYVGEYLDYVIRFQNTGNANATEVVITDLLDNNLQWNTIRPLSSSHEYRVEIRNGNEVFFIFENIDLPPESSDPEGSQGYVAYQIKSKSSLVVEDVVENTANIFFDFNPAIVTNTVLTRVVDLVPPTAICQSIIATLDETGEVTIEASNVDGGSTDTNGISMLEIDVNTFNCSQVGDNEVILTVTDTYGNVSTCTSIVTVQDVTAPVIVCSNASVSLGENGTMSIDPMLFVDTQNTTDNCGIASFGVSIGSVNCDDIGNTLVVTIFAIDVNGNSSTCETTLDVLDEMAPVFDDTTLPLDAIRYVDSNGVYVLEDFTSNIFASDNCNNVSIVQQPDVNSPLVIGVYTITIVASDGYDNTTQHTFELTVDEELGIQNFSIEDQLQIYPNPASDILYLDASEGIFIEKSVIYSLLGEKVLISSEERIDVSRLSKGVYFIDIKTNRGRITKKIVKE